MARCADPFAGNAEQICRNVRRSVGAEASWLAEYPSFLRIAFISSIVAHSPDWAS